MWSPVATSHTRCPQRSIHASQLPRCHRHCVLLRSPSCPSGTRHLAGCMPTSSSPASDGDGFGDGNRPNATCLSASIHPLLQLLATAAPGPSPPRRTPSSQAGAAAWRRWRPGSHELTTSKRCQGVEQEDSISQHRFGACCLTCS